MMTTIGRASASGRVVHETVMRGSNVVDEVGDAGQRLEDSVVQQGAVLTRERVVDLVCTELWQRIATRNEWLEQALKGGCDVTATVLRAEIQLLVALEKDYVLLLSKED